MTGSLALVLGGARSGKSRRAEEIVAGHPAPWTYLATGQAFDGEMETRIRHHRARRGEGWETVEAPLDLGPALDAVPEGRPVLLDCLTLWLSNQLLAGRDLAREEERLCGRLERPRGPWVCVSNEVGLGIVPDNALARAFRDAQGRLNQRVAALADEVLFMAAGLPMRLK